MDANISPPLYNWTPTGMVVIAMLLRGTLDYNKRMGLRPSTYRDFPASHTCIRNYANAMTQNPQQKGTGAPALAAIAPHLYYFVELNGDQVIFDASRKYKDWHELAKHVGELPSDKHPGIGATKGLSFRPVQEGYHHVVHQDIDDDMVASIVDRLVEERLAPIMNELMALRSVLTVVPPPSMQPIEAFLHSWVKELDEEQRAGLGIVVNEPWAESKSRLTAALSAEGLISGERAQEVISGSGAPPSPQEKLLLSFKFQQPITRLQYPMEFWDQFSTAPELCAA